VEEGETSVTAGSTRSTVVRAADICRTAGDRGACVNNLPLPSSGMARSRTCD